MLIRALVASDAQAYRALMLEAYGVYPQAFTSSVAERASMPLSWWEKRLDNPLDRLFGAFADDRLAGIVGLAFEPREKARHKVTLFGMYVNAAYQRHGLGRRLVEAALGEARQRAGLKVIQLTVTAGNDAAFALYQRCGFIQYGLEPLAVRVGLEYFDKIHMWRELQPD
ncbi:MULTISPECIES: GNAT family N-acetyltransferase [Pseudomonas]|jgi:ribosomal protein S18 acetylase RimI-like enzyme|uniref:GNAT family N-acetyltransferase n=2 Tax=Pseudomonas TaxID=286 RepID=A0A4Y9TFZ8_PSEFL|nr:MULTISPECIES: GNAT family N-acetyltransferase [Pseudomonas]MCX9150990.1 GNAT family N-acetyltransferase [Pseudomonas sp. TB1-B1]QXH68533.1 GNAT family N-acetyltransferase [Pseudomonas asgharzadehiana]TFW42938.1 GNAT family N-acetyltransferase [Pseudomonas fluorescens]TKJ64384.1 GNAT family N-acetyltransferase [Pseudomonas sp. CFBP13506]CRM20008.1 Protease synthase and sporulation negative regulatory protein PAI 1 [Pseudomonas sp. 31 E 5]